MTIPRAIGGNWGRESTRLCYERERIGELASICKRNFVSKMRTPKEVCLCLAFNISRHAAVNAIPASRECSQELRIERLPAFRTTPEHEAKPTVENEKHPENWHEENCQQGVRKVTNEKCKCTSKWQIANKGEDHQKFAPAQLVPGRIGFWRYGHWSSFDAVRPAGIGWFRCGR